MGVYICGCVYLRVCIFAGVYICGCVIADKTKSSRCQLRSLNLCVPFFLPAVNSKFPKFPKIFAFSAFFFQASPVISCISCLNCTSCENSPFLKKIPARTWLMSSNLRPPRYEPLLIYNQSPTGNCSTAWRKTGSTFVYTLFVKCGEECSSSLCVTAVDIPF